MQVCMICCVARQSCEQARLEIPSLEEAPPPAVVVVAAVGRASQLLPLCSQRRACAGPLMEGGAAASPTCS